MKKNTKQHLKFKVSESQWGPDSACVSLLCRIPLRLYVNVFVLPWGESEGLSHGARLIGWIHLEPHQNPAHGPGPNSPAASVRHDATDSNLTHSSRPRLFPLSSLLPSQTADSHRAKGTALPPPSLCHVAFFFVVVFFAWMKLRLWERKRSRELFSTCTGSSL